MWAREAALTEIAQVGLPIGGRAISVSNLSAYAAAMLLLFRIVLGEPALGIVAAGFMGSVAIANLSASMSVLDRNPTLTIGLVACSLVAIYNGILYEWRPLFYMALAFVHFGVAWIAIREPDFALKLARHLLAIWLLIVVTLAVLKGFGPDQVNEWFPTGSRNLIGFVAIALQVFYSAALFLRQGRIALITPLMTFVVCYLAFGRSGVLIGFALAAASLWFWLWSKSAIFRKAILPFLLTVVVYFAWQNFEDIIFYASEHTNFAERGLDSPRFAMWEDYWDHLTGISIVTGVDLKSLATLVDFGGNPHNSFLRGYSYFGLPFVMLMLWIVARGALAAKNSLFLCSLFFLFIARAATDSVAFFESFDFVLFYVWMALIRFRGHRTAPAVRPVLPSRRAVFPAN